MAKRKTSVVAISAGVIAGLWIGLTYSGQKMTRLLERLEALMNSDQSQSESIADDPDDDWLS